jgi:uncharacterized protein (TIGR02246 family)
MDAATSLAGKTEVRQCMESWVAAVKSLDLDRIMSHYSQDVVAFDAIMQLQFKGVEAYRKHWEMCLKMCPGPMTFGTQDVDIDISGDLAVVHCLVRCGAADEQGAEKASWMRMTSSYRRMDGDWKITHEHFSAPVDMKTGKALFDLDPQGQDKVRGIPTGMNAITPHLVCVGAADAIEFYKKAFGATEEGRLDTPRGKVMHACVRIGDSAIFLMDEMPDCGALSPQALNGSPITIHLYVNDADAVVKKAVAAGAKVMMPLQDMFWGDRYGVLEDPFGHRWSIATHVRDVSPEEIQEAAAKACEQG